MQALYSHYCKKCLSSTHTDDRHFFFAGFRAVNPVSYPFGSDGSIPAGINHIPF